MKHKYLLLILIIISVFTLYAERVLVRIPNASRELLNQYRLDGADIAAFAEEQYLDLVWPAAALETLRQEHPDLQISYTEAEIKANMQARDLPGYRSYQQMLDYLYQLEATYPSLIQVEVIGQGWGKEYANLGIPAYAEYQHDIHAVKLSANVSMDEDEPAFYLLGAHHAREPISMEVCVAILEQWAENYGFDPQITNILDTAQVWLVPLMNPDGHKLVIDQTDIWWRKNIRDNNGNESIDTASYGSGQDGVDINRNYSYMWGNISASDNPFEVTYHGLYPFSEPETSALKTLLESRRFLAGISYHTYGEWVLYPYGYASNLYAPDEQELAQLAIDMAATIPKTSSGTYTPSPSFGLYPVSGSLDDWSYGTRGTFAYTIEMADQFIPPASQVPVITQNHLEAAKVLLQRKDKKVLCGHVSDAVSRSPLQATIFVEGIDDHYLPRAEYQSNEDFGAYWRFLPVGTYSVQFICEGYLPQTHEVQIYPTQQSVLDVSLVPAVQISQHIYVVDDIANPIPMASVSINDGIAMQCNEQGMIVLNDIPSGIYRVRISKSGYASLDTQVEFNGADRIFTLTANPLFMDGFEQGSTSWYLQGGWGIENSESYSGSQCLSDSPGGDYSNNSSSKARTLQSYDLQGYRGINVQFMAKWEIMNDGDYFSFGYMGAGGEENTIHVFQGTQDWQAMDFELSFLQGMQVYFYFRLQSGSGASADGIYIDDFSVFASTAFVANEDQVVPSLKMTCGPNPFRHSLGIWVPKAAAQPAAIDIYNLRGQLVRSIANKNLTAMEGSVVWDGRDANGRNLASGIYFVRLTDLSGNSISRKVLKLK